MNLKRFFSKNAFIILVIVILGLFFVFFRKTEGFQASCNMSYCNDNNYETVTTKSGQKLCLEKCNKIKANYVTATSDPTICKEMSGTTVVKIVSRNIKKHSKLNQNKNNSCQTPVPAKLVNASPASKCAQLKGVYFTPPPGGGTERCYVCFSHTTTPVRNAQGVYMCN